MNRTPDMLGKSLPEYVVLQKPILILISAVWALRQAFSMAGAPVWGAQLLSVTGVSLMGALYYGWAVGARGFGSYKQGPLLTNPRGSRRDRC